MSMGVTGRVWGGGNWVWVREGMCRGARRFMRWLVGCEEWLMKWQEGVSGWRVRLERAVWRRGISGLSGPFFFFNKLSSSIMGLPKAIRSSQRLSKSWLVCFLLHSLSKSWLFCSLLLHSLLKSLLVCSLLLHWLPKNWLVCSLVLRWLLISSCRKSGYKDQAVKINIGWHPGSSAPKFKSVLTANGFRELRTTVGESDKKWAMGTTPPFNLVRDYQNDRQENNLI